VKEEIPTSARPSAAPERSPVASVEEKYVTFVLGSEYYGIPVLCVREIIRMSEVTPIPQMPPFVLGVINLRGKVIPVMDFKIQFNLPASKVGARTCVIVVEMRGEKGNRNLVGILVDSVEEVCVIPNATIQPAPNFGNAIHAEYISGVARIRNQVKTLLNLEKLIRAEAVGSHLSDTPM
jgi:purine-binding chemotaxis protein CheW